MNLTGRNDRIFRLEGLEAVRINACESRRRQEVKSAGIRRAEHLIVMDDIWKNDPEISGLHVIKCFADPEFQCPFSYIDTLDGFVNMGRIMDGSFFIDFHSVLFQLVEKVHKAAPFLQDLAGLSFLLTRIIAPATL